MRIIALLLLQIFILTSLAMGQSKKEKREAKRAVLYQLTDSLINLGYYQFMATKAIPGSGHPVNLTTHTAELDIKGDSVYAYLPFFGRAFQPTYGGDGGIKFEVPLNNYVVEKDTVKNNFAISFTAKANNDTYKCSFSVFMSGSATLSIISNRRAQISFYGNIIALPKN